MEEVTNIGLNEFIRKVRPKEVYEDMVIIMEMDGSLQKNIPSDAFPLRFEGYSALLVCQGEVSVTVDYTTHLLQQNMVLEYSQIHLINDVRMSHNFLGYHLIVSGQVLQHLVNDLTSIPKEYGSKKRLSPVQKLDNREFHMLTDLIERLRASIAEKDHFFRKGVILNNTYNFIMELLNIDMQKAKGESHTFKMNHYEELAMRFARLLATHCREWNEVADYSTELCVTPVYLSRAMKQISKKSALEWIAGARLTEAKVLLRNRSYTVQDVADMLNFSDQSAFGKFFKKQTGISPVEYKKQLLQNENVQ